MVKINWIDWSAFASQPVAQLNDISPLRTETSDKPIRKEWRATSIRRNWIPYQREWVPLESDRKLILIFIADYYYGEQLQHWPMSNRYEIRYHWQNVNIANVCVYFDWNHHKSWIHLNIFIMLSAHMLVRFDIGKVFYFM